MSRRQVWLVGVGGIYGVVVRRYIDFLILHNDIPTPLFFAAASLLFCPRSSTFLQLNFMY